jgi:hypothetical protein
MQTKSPAPLVGSGDRAGTGFAERRSSTREPVDNQAPLRQSVANQALPQRMELVQWRPKDVGALRGHATIRLPIGLEISGVAVFRGAGGRAWAQWPAEAVKNAAGEPVRDSNGKPLYRGPNGLASRCRIGGPNAFSS